jgi:hypothetical protein
MTTSSHHLPFPPCASKLDFYFNQNSASIKQSSEFSAQVFSCSFKIGGSRVKCARAWGRKVYPRRIPLSSQVCYFPGKETRPASGSSMVRVFNACGLFMCRFILSSCDFVTRHPAVRFYHLRDVSWCLGLMTLLDVQIGYTVWVYFFEMFRRE